MQSKIGKNNVWLSWIQLQMLFGRLVVVKHTHSGNTTPQMTNKSSVVSLTRFDWAEQIEEKNIILLWNRLCVCFVSFLRCKLLDIQLTSCFWSIVLIGLLACVRTKEKWACFCASRGKPVGFPSSMCEIAISILRTITIITLNHAWFGKRAFASELVAKHGDTTDQ